VVDPEHDFSPGLVSVLTLLLLAITGPSTDDGAAATILPAGSAGATGVAGFAEKKAVAGGAET
jgi:hypothetical protein